jgi:hypothetical protein
VHEALWLWAKRERQSREMAVRLGCAAVRLCGCVRLRCATVRQRRRADRARAVHGLGGLDFIEAASYLAASGAHPPQIHDCEGGG